MSYVNINNILRLYNDCYLLVSDNYVVEAGNDFYKLTGYNKKDILGKHFIEVCKLLKLDIGFDASAIDINSKYFLHSHDCEVKEMRILQEKTIHEKMNIYYFINCSKDNDESTENIISKKEEHTLSGNEAFEMYDRLKLPAFVVSYADFKILNLNKKAFGFIKYCKERNIQISKLFPDFFSEVNVDLIKKMKETKNLVYSRKNKLILGNSEMYFNYIYHPLIDMNNETNQFLLILEDITKEVIEKKHIEKAAKLQEEFFSFITHEFRTPLTTICSTLQFLELVYKDEITENIKKYIYTIKRNTYQQLRLVNNLLDITRAESGYLVMHKKNQDIVSLTKAISDSVRDFAESRNIKVKFCTKLKQKYTAVDDEKYERIILNLLSNAIKFTPKDKNIYVTLSSDNNKIIICIRDEGVGISENMQKLIFNKFRQVGNRLIRNSEGSGIGLYLVKLLVEKMDGTIKLISRENKGSSFIITLPEEIIENQEMEAKCKELTDDHIVQSMQMEFSVIYDA